MHYPPHFVAALTYAGLAAGLVFLCISADKSPYFILAAQLSGLALWFKIGTWTRSLRRPAVYLPLIGVGLLLLASSFSAKTLEDLLPVLLFAPMVLIGPLITVFERSKLAFQPALIGSLALIGAGGAMLLALYEVTVLGLPRAGSIANNPIHFAGAAALLGFVSLVGLASPIARWRLGYLLGPVFATVAVMLSGSRGALVAIVVLYLAAIGTAVLLFRHDRKTWLGIGLSALMAGAVIAAFNVNFDLVQRTLNPVSGIIAASGNSAAVPTMDGSTSLRIGMYQSAANALAASPLVGHGAHFMQAAQRYAPVGLDLKAFDHLHSDMADFAVIGGGLGLLAYAALLLAPLIEALRAQGPDRAAVVLLGMVTVVGYFILGLTNATFGILALTVFFPFLTALTAVLAHAPSKVDFGEFDQAANPQPKLPLPVSQKRSLPAR